MRKLKLFLTTMILSLPALAGADIADLEKDINQRMKDFEVYVQYAGQTLVEAAKEPDIKQYFMTSDPAEKDKLKHKIDFLSLSTQAKFNVDEMCLIDKNGQEISRIVYQQVAPDKDLSSEEASAPFFSPAFKEADGHYHVSAPYVSADSLRWVVCFATPIVMADGSKPAIYHYEKSLYIIQGILNKGLTPESDRFLLFINKEGYVVSDSRKKFKLEFNASDTEMLTPFSDYFPKFAGYLDNLPGNIIKLGKQGNGKTAFAGSNYLYTYKPLAYNDWTAVMFEKIN